MNKIRKGDQVIVIAGRDKGKRGVVTLRKDDDHVIVEGINLLPYDYDVRIQNFLTEYLGAMETVKSLQIEPGLARRYDDASLKIGELGSPPATTALAKGARFRIVASGVRRRCRSVNRP